MSYVTIVHEAKSEMVFFLTAGGVGKSALTIQLIQNQ